MVPFKSDEAAEEEPASLPGKKIKAPDAGMQASASFDEAINVCEARVGVRLDAPKLLMLKLVEQVAAETVVKATPGACSALLSRASQLSSSVCAASS